MPFAEDNFQDSIASLLMGRATGRMRTPGLSDLLLQRESAAPVPGLSGITPWTHTDLTQAVRMLGSNGPVKLQVPATQPTAGASSEAGGECAAPTPAAVGQARTIYGESSGLYPQLQAGGANLYHPADWDSQSADQLKTAREWIAGVGLRNPKVHGKSADLSNRTERMMWNVATDAAQGAQKLQLPPGVDHFFMRQEGKGHQKPPWGKGGTPYEGAPYKTFGPFINVGGGRVPAGSKTYIDFYQGVP